MNEWRRRSFLRLMPLVFLANPFLPSSQPAGEPATPAALTLMRDLITVQAELGKETTLPDGTRAYFPASKADMLAALAADIQNADPATASGAFLKTLVPNDRNGEILAGWITDIDIKPNGYVIITSQKIDPANPSAKRDAYSTDQSAVIYRARILGPTQPSAASLQKGIDFPGAVPFDLYHE